MADLLVVPLKKPIDVDIVKPLTNLIQSAYSNSTTDYTVSVNDFSKLRNSAVWKAFEKSDGALEILYGYFDQICSLESKIPVQELQVPFKWKDAFDKGSLFGGRISLTLTSLLYEKVCVLFNIAALQSALAASQNLDSDDGMKTASKLFQQSAGLFTHLKAITPAAIPQEPTPDLTSETLQMLSSLMVAQAQEIFVIKAIKDNMKDLIVAKLACQCEELYADVLRNMQKDSVRSIIDKEWLGDISGKQAGFHAMTQLYHSLNCRANKSIGEEIARLQNAVELFKAAQSRSGKSNLFEEYLNKAQRNLAESTKDNNFIYNEMIPDVKTLDGPGKAQLAKVIPYAQPLGSNQKDMFAQLVPVALHQAITACDARKTEIVNGEIMKLRDATQMLNGMLTSLNLPAAIEVTAGGSVPQSLLDKANNCKEKGGVTSIRNLITELPELLTRNREILDECEKMLNEERDSDNKLRAQFKERWTRTPSDKLTDMFRSNAGKYREIITNAIAADKVVQSKFEVNVKGIEMLSQSADELQRAVPSGSGPSLQNNATVQKLRQLMQSVDGIKAEREVIESELKSATIDLKDKFILALAQDGAINEPALSLAEIGKQLNPLQTQVQDSIKRQETLVADIKSSHEAFVKEFGSSGSARDAMLTQLATAYDVFVELQNNLNEGTKFYNDLTQLLVVFQNKINDFCFARKTEKDELMKDLTHESSRSVPAPTPFVPAAGSDAGAAGGTCPAPSGGTMPYPTQMQGMPMPYGATAAAPYPTFVAPPMPQGFNPYATLPYPNTPYNYQNFPQGPQHYGTYPGSYANQQQQGPYPHQQQKPPGW